MRFGRKISEKISNHHGKQSRRYRQRQLEHSRATELQGETVPHRSLNCPADEYFEISYHGMRAIGLNPSNADFETEFDASLPKVNVVSQDIGRSILNLIQ